MVPLIMRRALLIGIDEYYNAADLNGCVADATKMSALLERNEDGTLNFDCRLFTNLTSDRPIDRQFLRDVWQRLFRDFTGDILFYYSGHGLLTEMGCTLVLQDGALTDPGISMSELLQLAKQSKAREVTLILDCCFTNKLSASATRIETNLVNQAQLRKGLTILAASSPDGFAEEKNGHGVFTSLVMDALAGGAADIRGYISVASIYTFVDQALGAWDQRPLFISYINRLHPIRRCKPPIGDTLLMELPLLFPTPDSRYRLKPSYEFTHKSAKKENVDVFNKFKLYRDVRLLRTVGGDDLFFTALKSKYVELTPLGKFYWHLAKEKRL